jgi:hypothetical protein
MLQVSEILGFNKKEAANFLINLLDAKSVCINHPKLNTPTFARASKTKGMVNVIHFSDQNLENHWYFIQVTKLLEAYIVDDELINPTNLPAIEPVKKWMDDGELSFDLTLSSSSVNGLIFSQKRPFHYFYDQFVNYFTLSAIQNINEFCFTDDYCFYSDIKGTKFKKIDKEGCYFFPCTIPRNIDGEDTTEMHDFFRSNIDTIDFDSDLTIWIGITGQKRSWLEQIDGYVSLVKSISAKFDNITVIVDGWTNYEDDKSFNKEDNKVYSIIKDKLSLIKSINLISLIDENYKTKISYANACDYFIANSGTGCMVPFAICNIKGVIHGNGRVHTFRKIYNENVREVSKDKIIAEQIGIPMYTSYSIAWEVIYNYLMELMADSTRLNEPNLDSKIIFSKWVYSEKARPADALRDLAFAFHQTGDTKVAYSIMCKALEQRPDGPLIRQKVEEWKSEIEAVSNNN